MLPSQRNKFDLPRNVAYLNCASMSPLMKRLAVVGKKAIDLRVRPYNIKADDWFKPVETLKKNFAKLINVDNYHRIAIIPSVSYGIATVAKNINLSSGEEIILLDEQFPSNYYSWHHIANTYNAKIKIIKRPSTSTSVGKLWNERIINSISKNTRIVTLGNIHWTDGTVFDLEQISKVAKAHNALLIVDGSQSIGALPFDVQKIKPDAVFSVGYKWLLGPLSLGMGYYGAYFDDGIPLEENWLNRQDSDNFQKLTDYTPLYTPLAGRYNVGENSNFHLLPILNEAIVQLLQWEVSNIQHYCHHVTRRPIQELQELGCQIEDEKYRSGHLFGIKFHNAINLQKLHQTLIRNKIHASLRGESLRISAHVFTDSLDLKSLVKTIKASMTHSP